MRPDVVVTDDSMPDGTAHQCDMAGRFGAVAYLQKPLDFDSLVARMQEHCDLRPRALDEHSLAS